jgi:hypothetical protein
MSEEFCDGVKILLKRMESNPEEFEAMDRWEEFVNLRQLKDGFWSNALTPTEIEALQDGMRKIFRDVFTSRVMAKLLEDKEEEPLRYSATERYAHGWTDPRGLVSLGGAGGGGTGFLGQGKRVQTNAYPTQSPYAESQPPKEKLSLGEMLKNKLKYSL